MNNDLIERVKNYLDTIPDDLRYKSPNNFVAMLDECLAALSRVLPDSEWYDTCASVKRVIVDMVDEDPNKIISRVNDILDNAFGRQAIPAPVLPEDVQRMIEFLRAEDCNSVIITPDQLEAADLIERLARENAFLQKDYDAVHKRADKLQARMEELALYPKKCVSLKMQIAEYEKALEDAIYKLNCDGPSHDGMLVRQNIERIRDMK